MHSPGMHTRYPVPGYLGTGTCNLHSTGVCIGTDVGGMAIGIYVSL